MKQVQPRNINIAALSSLHSISPPRPIRIFFSSPTSSIENYKNSIPCVERIVHGFSLNSFPKFPPALQNVLYHEKSIYFRSFKAAIDLDDALDADGFGNINRSLSLKAHHAKKTKGIEILQKPDLRVQLAVSVRFTGF